MKTNECARMADVSIDTLRYYEKIGLIKPHKKGYSRDYTYDDIEILKAITILKSTGMSLKNIKHIVNIKEDKVDYYLLKRILENQLESIVNQEKALKKAKLILTNARDKVLGAIK